MAGDIQEGLAFGSVFDGVGLVAVGTKSHSFLPPFLFLLFQI